MSEEEYKKDLVLPLLSSLSATLVVPAIFLKILLTTSRRALVLLMMIAPIDTTLTCFEYTFSDSRAPKTLASTLPRRSDK